MLVPGLSKIKHIECGSNHVLALDANGSVFAWGSGQQNQLGRRVVERTRMAGLTPREFGLPKKKVKLIGVGAYHSFAVDNKDNVWAWGLNSYGECGVSDNAGDDEASVAKPTKVDALGGKGLTCIKGGAHHSVAVTKDGDCLVWGRTDSGQTGLKLDSLPEEDLRKDEHGKPRILLQPTKIPGMLICTAWLVDQTVLTCCSQTLSAHSSPPSRTTPLQSPPTARHTPGVSVQTTRQAKERTTMSTLPRTSTTVLFAVKSSTGPVLADSFPS